MPLFLAVLCAHAATYPTMINNNGAAVHWAAMPVEFSVDPRFTAGLDPDDVGFALVDAASAWESVAGAAIEMPFLGTSTDTETDSFGVPTSNVVRFTTDWDSDDSIMALTGLWSTTDGQALGFDLTVNAEDYTWATDGRSDRMDFQSVLTHELGHALGIGHVQDDDEATMSPSDHLGATQKRDLAPIDAEIAAAFYPGGALDLPESVAPMGCSTSGTGGEGPLWTPFLAALLLVRRRPMAVSPTSPLSPLMPSSEA